jgi:hypothetical protein
MRVRAFHWKGAAALWIIAARRLVDGPRLAVEHAVRWWVADYRRP